MKDQAKYRPVRFSHRIGSSFTPKKSEGVSDQHDYVAAQKLLVSLEASYHATPMGLAFLDPEFRYVCVNEEFCRMYDQPIDHFLGQTVSQALPAWASQILANMGESLEKNVRVETEISLPEKSAVYLRTCEPVREADGRLVGLAVALMNITSRKLADAALKESEENYRLSTELNPHMPWTSNADGTQVQISSRWTTLTGQDEINMSTAAWARKVHPEDLPGAVAAWSGSIHSGNPYRYEYRIHCRDGSYRWFRAQATARVDDQKQVIRWYGIMEDIDEEKRINAELKEKTIRLEAASRQLAELLRIDHLTEIANRRHFDDVLEKEVTSSFLNREPLALIMIDVDHFKRFNDTYGHVLGDQCLRQVAQTLRQTLHRPKDLVARYGGEEFAFVLPNTTLHGALIIAERVLESIRRVQVEVGPRGPVGVTISAGVAMLSERFDISTTVMKSSLIEQADLALYEAKKTGRDRVFTSAK